MGVIWEETLLHASARRARDWASSNPIKFAFLFALPPFLIPASIGTVYDIPAGLIALAVVLVVWFLALIMKTFLTMFEELRRAVALLEQAANDVAGATPAETEDIDSPNGFDCRLVERDDEWVQVEIHNRSGRSSFQARIREVRGEKSNGTWPLTVRWAADAEAAEREIGSGDLDVLNVVRVRGRRAVDFLRPEVSDTPYERVAAAADGERFHVLAQLVVYRKEEGVEIEHQERVLRLCFDNGEQLPAERQLLPITAVV